MQTEPPGTVVLLAGDERSAVRRLVREEGERHAAARLGIARATLRKLVRGEPVRRGSFVVAVAALLERGGR